MPNAPSLSSARLQGAMIPSAARLRARSRARASAAALFIVAMTLAVLAAVGVYALRAAAIEITTAGYERQSMQTHYLAEYGVLSTAAAIDSNSMALGWMAEAAALCQSAGTDASVPSCQSIPASYRLGTVGKTDAGGAGCTEVGSQSLVGVGNTPLVIGVDGGTGSLGMSTIQGDFVVDINSPKPAEPAAGNNAQSARKAYYVPVVSYGYVGNDISSSAASSQSEGVEVQQATLVTMPIIVPWKNVTCGQ